MMAGGWYIFRNIQPVINSGLMESSVLNGPKIRSEATQKWVAFKLSTELPKDHQINDPLDESSNQRHILTHTSDTLPLQTALPTSRNQPNHFSRSN